MDEKNINIGESENQPLEPIPETEEKARGAELVADEYLPTPEELEELKAKLNAELDKLL